MDEARRLERFHEWSEQHGAIVERAARAFARGADRDDLRQELLLAIWRAIPSFRGEARPSTFLYRVVHNAALLWRRGRRAAAESLESIVEPAAPEREGDEGRLAALYAAIRRLPPVDRSLVLLSLDGVAYAEMAEIHGLTPNAVGARLTRARDRLATDLERSSE